MGNARIDFEWGQSSTLMALIANCHRDKKRKSTPYKPVDFHPGKSGGQDVKVEGDITDLKKIFVDRSI